MKKILMKMLIFTAAVLFIVAIVECNDLLKDIEQFDKILEFEDDMDEIESSEYMYDDRL
jgi:hypothetical protein